MTLCKLHSRRRKSHLHDGKAGSKGERRLLGEEVGEQRGGEEVEGEEAREGEADLGRAGEGEEGEQGDGGQDSTVGERGGDFEGRCDPGAIEEEDIDGLEYC